MTTHLCASMLVHTDGCSRTHMHFPAAHALMHVCEHTRSCAHTCSHTQHTHTRVPQQPGMAPVCTFSSPGRDTGGQPPRPFGPMLCDVPQFPLLAQPSTPTPPAPVGPCVARASRAGWSLARPRGWHRRHFPEPSTSNRQLIRQPNTTALPVPQPNRRSRGQLSLQEAASSPIFSQPLQPASWQNPATVRVKASQGTGTLPGYPLIWDMPAWPHCSEHHRSGEQCHHQILAVPLPARANTQAHPRLNADTEVLNPTPRSLPPAGPRQGSVTQFPHFPKEDTPPQLWAGSFGAGKEGGGRLCVSHTYQCPSIQPSLLEREREVC